jgi:hypothetical protein
MRSVLHRQRFLPFKHSSHLDLHDYGLKIAIGFSPDPWVDLAGDISRSGVEPGGAVIADEPEP